MQLTRRITMQKVRALTRDFRNHLFVRNELLTIFIHYVHPLGQKLLLKSACLFSLVSETSSYSTLLLSQAVNIPEARQ
jgi:hypothetical protein